MSDTTKQAPSPADVASLARPRPAAEAKPSEPAGTVTPARRGHRGAGARTLPRGHRLRHRLRHPRRRDPPGLRPDARLQEGAPHPRAPRAGRRPRGRGVCRRRPARSACAWRRRARARRTSSPRSPTRTWTPCPSSPSPGRSRARAIGTDAFQEADIRGITMPITKHNYLVTDPAKIPQAIAEAFHVASTGRPGPVLVDISKDALQATTTFSWPPQIDLPGYRPGACARTASRSARPPASWPRPSGRSSTSAAASSGPARARRCAASSS